MSPSTFSRLIVVSALAAAATTMCWAQAPAAQERGGQEMTAEMKARLEKAPKFAEMFTPMRDSVVLAENVYLPPGNGPFQPFCCGRRI